MPRLVKICGIKTIEAASVAIDNGADLLGCILVPNRARTISHEIAQQISINVKKARESRNRKLKTPTEIQEYLSMKSFTDPNEYFETISQVLIENGPFLVGVFRNQSIEDVFSIANELQLDFIQLHGSEDKVDFIERNGDSRFGIIPRYVIPKELEGLKVQLVELMKKRSLSIPLLDSEAGGEGKVIDWDYISENLGFTRVILAGGLHPGNLKDTETIKNVIGYDVSGGVEDEQGNKDLQKIKDFIKIGKALP